jgi:hypothetical protein
VDKSATSAGKKRRTLHSNEGESESRFENAAHFEAPYLYYVEVLSEIRVLKFPKDPCFEKFPQEDFEIAKNGLLISPANHRPSIICIQSFPVSVSALMSKLLFSDCQTQFQKGYLDNVLSIEY